VPGTNEAPGTYSAHDHNNSTRTLIATLIAFAAVRLHLPVGCGQPSPTFIEGTTWCLPNWLLATG